MKGMKDSIILTREYIELIEQLVESKQADELKRRLDEMHPADIAEMCDDMSIEDARYIYHLLEGEDAADVLIEMDEDARNELLEEVPSETIARKFIDFMDTDDAVDIIRDMDEEKQEEILSHIEDIEQAGDIVDLLKYDEDTAGGIMGTEMVTVNENWSMPDCLREMRLQAEDRDEIYNVYVVDDEERLQGVFPLTQTSMVCWISIRIGKEGSSLHGFPGHSYAVPENAYSPIAVTEAGMATLRSLLQP